MKKVFIVRGAFLNPFELQNYSPLKEKFDIKVLSSKHPISDRIDLPLIKLWSPTDLPDFPFKYPLLNRLFTDAHQLFGLEKVIKGTDIVHVAETYYGYTHQTVMAKRRGLIKKIVSTVWEVIPHNNEGIRGRKKYKKQARENIDHFIAVTHLAKKTLIKEGVSESKISVIPVGVDLHRFRPVIGAKRGRTINILCVARLVPEKGVEDLMKAFLKISETNKHVHLTFIGDGPLRQDLSGFKNVHIKKVPYGQIHHEYQKADIFCLPSRETKTWAEQYGLSLVEAMATGLPIVTTLTGAILEVCGEVAIYSRPGVPSSLQTNLEKLIYNVELRQKMGREARHRAIALYDHRQIAQKLRQLYRRICH